MTNKFITICLALILVIMAPLQTVAQPETTAQGTPTIFLPLKINSLTDSDKLSKETDLLLKAAAAGNGMTMLARDKAITKLQEAGWPPPAAALQEIMPSTGQHNVAVGSLTRLGDGMSLDLTVFDLTDPGATSYFFKDIPAAGELAPVINEVVKEISNFSNRHQLIASLEIAGNRRIDTGAIIRKISSRAGEEYAAAKLNKDLKEVFSMGYFSDIRIDSSETPIGYKITFTVVEKDLVGKIKLSGNDALKDDDIMTALKIKSHSIINDLQIRESIANINKLCREEGYFNCQIKVDQSKAAKDRVDLTFVIDEGNKIFIKEIIFTGNKSFKDQKIKDAISTSEKGLLSFITDSGLMNKEKLEQDATRIAAFYHNNGFVEAKIGEPEIVQKEEWFYVYFNISEGERYKCGKVTISGDLIAKEAVLLKKVKVDEEEFFSRMVLREDVLRITDFYAEKGYAFAEINPKTTRNEAEKTVDLDLRVAKGQLVTIDRINIKGNNRTRDKVIRREIKLKEGGLFNATELKESNQRLMRIDFFEDVNISPEPGIDDTQLSINVEIKEKPTGKFSIGGGYSSVDKLTFMVEVSENNLFGRGQKLSTQANISSKSNKFNINFTEPHLFDTKLLMSFSIYNWQREYDDYTKDSKGGSLAFGYPLWEKWRLNLGIGIDDTTLSDITTVNPSQEILDSMDYHKTNSVKVALLRDTRNRLYGASKGSRNDLDLKYAGGPLAGDISYTKIEGASSWYFPISKSTTFHAKLTAGYIAGNNEGYLPVFEKFYLGGITTVRSFDNGQISPIDNTGKRIGGDKMWYSNLEYIFPLAKTQGIMGVIFYDIGNVYGREAGWLISEYKHSTGAGIRWMSPIGPLRLEWGYNLDSEAEAKGEDKKNWEFNIGGQF